jgi:hypothetical protein
MEHQGVHPHALIFRLELFLSKYFRSIVEIALSAL